MLKLEENELLAALLTAAIIRDDIGHKRNRPEHARQWRETYKTVLREFMELEKAEYETTSGGDVLSATDPPAGSVKPRHQEPKE